MELKTKMSENGRIMIPAKIRELLHFEPGTEMILRVEAGELRIASLKNVIQRTQALVNTHTKGRSLVKELLKMRKEEQGK